MPDNSPQQRSDETPDEDGQDVIQKDVEGSPTPEEDILEKIPQSRRREILQTFASMTSATMSLGNPIANRFTSEHIGDMISIHREETRLEYDDRKHARVIVVSLIVFLVLVAMGFGVFLALRNMDALLTDLITKVIIGLGGFGAGWGAHSYYRRRE